jgi:hypothetical protein
VNVGTGTGSYEPADTAYWRRPECYLDAVIRHASSTFAQLPPSVVEPAIGARESGTARR